MGTTVYQAPEMIVNNTSGPFSDLWALGVIVYQMITGSLTWSETAIIGVQNQIINKKFTYPDYMQEDEKDLINRLLELDPLKRLGVGNDPSSENSIQALKSHPFFSTLNMSQIEK